MVWEALGRSVIPTDLGERESRTGYVSALLLGTYSGLESSRGTSSRVLGTYFALQSKRGGHMVLGSMLSRNPMG